MQRTKALLGAIVLLSVFSNGYAQSHLIVTSISKPDVNVTNSHYISNRQPLLKQPFIKLPVTAIKPGGWVKKVLELQRDGLMGKLGEISIWLNKMDNAWLNKEGKGKYGWEELPYWLKGYGDIAYVLKDPKMLAETKFWIDAVLNNQRESGDFGPSVEKKGNRDLWTNMPMIWCLQSYYDYSNDPRVLSFLTKYFKWELSVPDNKFLKDYWENSRGGDNLVSVYWLYNRTGDQWLLDLATKIDKNTGQLASKRKATQLAQRKYSPIL